MERTDQATAFLAEHLREFFEGHSIESVVWPQGPIEKFLPGFNVSRISPGPKSQLWSYISNGACRVNHPNSGRLEFLLLAREDSARCIELITMVAHYQFNRGLGIGHTFPIGEPWVPGSKCTSMLVSVPYPFGPSFEVCAYPQGHIHICWLLPITEAEREFKVAHGLEKLESLFEERAVEYWVPNRSSVA